MRYVETVFCGVFVIDDVQSVSKKVICIGLVSVVSVVCMVDWISRPSWEVGF